MQNKHRNPALGLAVFILVAVVGLYYVKWFPYYHKAFLAAARHSIGDSIITGKGAVAPAPSWQAALDYALVYGKAIWQALIVGLLLGSAVQSLLPRQWIIRVLGRTGFGSIAAGGMLALPSMMCTCCAAPVVVGLRKSRASVGAAIAYWLGNSVLNPATLIFMGFVLGWHWTVLRLVMGVVMVFGLGFLANRLVQPEEAVAAQEGLSQMVEVEAGSPFVRWLHSFWRLLIGLVPEYLVLVLLLGAARAWLFPHFVPGLGNSLTWIIGMAIAGTLFVIPTAGEIPIIQALMSLGMGAGPAGALLMTLPPVSLPSLAMVSKVFRPRLLLCLALAIAVLGGVTGLLAMALHF
jgi:uncharacterized protein